MPRPPDDSLRRALRERAVDYVLEHGLVDLSLRPLAAALGTSARMLVYHFGSREGLLREILAGLRAREDARVRAWFAARGGPRTLGGFVRWYWKRVGSPAGRRPALLVFELYALALRHPEDYPGVLRDPLRYWRGLVRHAGVPWDAKAESTATLLLAATRGLLLDVTASGGRARTTRALDVLLRSLGL